MTLRPQHQVSNPCAGLAPADLRSRGALAIYRPRRWWGVAGAVALLLVSSRTAVAQCLSDLACRDQNPLTVSWCRDRSCIHALRAQPSCKGPTARRRCLLDLQCWDGREDTVNWCHEGSCYAIDRASNGQCPVFRCQKDADCKDQDPQTRQWCHAGACVFADRSDPACMEPGSACVRRVDCRDANPRSYDWCFAGRCYHAQRSEGGQCRASSEDCEPFEVVIEHARRGAVNRPGGGDRWKVVGGSYQIRYPNETARTLSYHCFDLSDLEGVVVRADLEMTHSDNSYESRDSFETVVFRSIDRIACDDQLDISVLQTPSNHAEIFADLQDGPVLAQFQATLSDNNQTERFPVNSAGVSKIQQLLGTTTAFGMGGGLSTATGSDMQRVFRGTDDTAGVVQPSAKLTLTMLPPGCTVR